MRRILVLGIFVLSIISCNKKYEYIEVKREKSETGAIRKIEEDAEIIEAKNDSIAYLLAYEKFCISQKASKDMEEVYGSSSTNQPVYFKLINEKGNDITFTVEFQKKDSLKSVIHSQVFKFYNALK